MAKSELPQKPNQRGGPGWWMDREGAWRSPADWPEDTPPLDGWHRDPETGKWHPPAGSEPEPEISVGALSYNHQSVDTKIRKSDTIATFDPDQPSPKRERKLVLSIVGAFGAAAVVLLVAILMITQAGAEDTIEETQVQGAVLYAAETDLVRAQRRNQMALDAPVKAVRALAELDVRETVGSSAVSFDRTLWTAEPATDCLDISERILIARSQEPIIWADRLECVPDRGRWTDRDHGITILRTHEAQVGLLVPAAVAFSSGGDTWTAATRQAYLADVSHPATLQIFAVGTGHNPRNQDPSKWKPGNKTKWCAYAIDWIAVKERWELTVHPDERDALEAMLDSCSLPDSDGADPSTMVIDPLAAAQIERILVNS